MIKLRFVIVLVILVGVQFYGSNWVFADGLIIHDGATLTLNDVTLDLNCLDLIIEDGGTLDLGGGAVEECGVLEVSSGGDLIWGTGAIEYCQNNYTLTVNITGQGSVTLNPPGGTYNAGTNVTLTAVADPGWVFSGWSGDLTGSTNPETITMDSNKTVTATFTQDDDGGGGGGGGGGTCFIATAAR
jgi:uncharacterized repeat protein (TIGR02543 family)